MIGGGFGEFWRRYKYFVIVPFATFILLFAILIYLATRAPLAPFVYR